MNPGGVTLEPTYDEPHCSVPIGRAPVSSPEVRWPAQPPQPSRVCSQLSAFPALTLPRLPEELKSASRTAAPQLPPPALWGLGGGTEITGKGWPHGWRPHPKAALGTGPQSLCQLTHSLNRVEPKVSFYCKSRKILAGQANPEPSFVKGLGGLSWPFPQKHDLVGGK